MKSCVDNILSHVMSSHHSVDNLTTLISVPILRRWYYCCDTWVQHRIDKTEDTRGQITAINELQYKEKCEFTESVYLNGILLSTLVIKSRMKCIQAQRSQAAAYCARVISQTQKYTHKPIILNLDINLRGQIRHNCCCQQFCMAFIGICCEHQHWARWPPGLLSKQVSKLRPYNKFTLKS